MTKSTYTTLLIFFIGVFLLIPGLCFLNDALQPHGKILSKWYAGIYLLTGISAILISGVFVRRKKKR